MTAQASIPLKWYVPFANGDAGRVELPVTTADPTRASQTLGFPPLTMQPPESGGVPPQGEDFNGGMNQVARITWWTLNGGGWPFDATFATNSNINGYPNGALLQSSDFRGYWLNTSDNNQINPDTVGTNWVPAFQYGSTSIGSLTNANVTLSPLQAAKDGIALSGTLTGNIQVIVPAWLKNWSVTNNTTGAFAITFKTPSGSGIVVPQNGSPTTLAGDGTNITQPARNIALATSTFHGARFGQTTGRLLNIQAITSTQTYTPTTGTIFCKVTVIGGGASGGGAPVTTGTAAAVGGGGGGGAVAIGYYAVTTITGQTATIGAGGASASGAGNSGGTSGLGGIITASGGVGGAAGASTVPPVCSAGGVGGTTVVGGTILNGAGAPGTGGIAMTISNMFSGNGGGSYVTGGVAGRIAANLPGIPGVGYGCGGSGATSAGTGGPFSSGAGTQGIIIIEEFGTV